MKPLTAPSFEKIFREHLIAHGVNQAKFAEIVGLSQATLSRRLNDRPPTAEELQTWWGKAGWPQYELPALLSSIGQSADGQHPIESLIRLEHLAEAFPVDDPIFGQLRRGGVLHRLAAELMLDDGVAVPELRTIVEAACEMHRRGREARAQTARQLRMS